MVKYLDLSSLPPPQRGDGFVASGAPGFFAEGIGRSRFAYVPVAVRVPPDGDIDLAVAVEIVCDGDVTGGVTGRSGRRGRGPRGVHDDPTGIVPDGVVGLAVAVEIG